MGLCHSMAPAPRWFGFWRNVGVARPLADGVVVVSQGKTASKAKGLKFTINCAKPVDDEIFDISAFVRHWGLNHLQGACWGLAGVSVSVSVSVSVLGWPVVAPPSGHRASVSFLLPGALFGAVVSMAMPWVGAGSIFRGGSCPCAVDRRSTSTSASRSTTARPVFTLKFPLPGRPRRSLSLRPRSQCPSVPSRYWLVTPMHSSLAVLV